jgi:hypothetical protein
MMWRFNLMMDGDLSWFLHNKPLAGFSGALREAQPTDVRRCFCDVQTIVRTTRYSDPNTAVDSAD